MKNWLGALVVIGIGVIFYNEYKKNQRELKDVKIVKK
jgi:hypothetical protein